MGEAVGLVQKRKNLEALEKDHATAVKNAAGFRTKQQVRLGDAKKAQGEADKHGQDAKAEDRKAAQLATKITRLKADIAKDEKRGKS